MQHAEARHHSGLDASGEPASAAPCFGHARGVPCRHVSKTRIRGAADRRRCRYGRAPACRRRAAHAARSPRRCSMPRPARACSSRPRPCSAPARSSSAAPTTSSPRSPPEKRAGGVVAFSSGNHAQGVAHAAKLLDMPSVIVMPSDAPRPKRERTAAFGAEVVLYDRDKEDREGIARALAREARRDAGAALRRSVHHRGPGHRRAARSWRT